MKTIENEPNISRHKNGNLYYVARKKGKLTVKSLKTADLAEARRKIREMGILELTAAREPELPAVVLPVPQPAVVAETKPTAPVLTLAEALTEHDRGLILLAKGTKEMAVRGRKAIERFAKDWEDFSPVAIWNDYRETGLERQGALLGSAANHLLWYLGKFIPWAAKRGFVGADALESLAEIPRLTVNSRTIRVPSVEVVEEFLAMVESEDPDGGAYLRFLTTSGVRLSGGIGLRWKDIDFAAVQMAIMQKGGKRKIIPMTAEAVEVLKSREGKMKPFDLDQNAVERLERVMKRFAKGFEIDLTFFHAFRHYFASRCLLSGFTVQEVAKLLGHSDNGVLVLKTYGHICSDHMKERLAGLRLTGR
ncbi:MAG: site-specific integrase [Verrucomicrobiota bacterium]